MKRPFRWITLIVIFIGIGILALLAYFWFSVYVLPKSTPGQERLEAYLGFPLPSDATNLQIHIVEGVRDRLYFARFTVSQASYDAFIEAVCTEPGQSVNAEPSYNLGVGGVAYPDWWYTDQRVIDFTGRCNVDLFVDQDASGALTIYLVGF